MADMTMLADKGGVAVAVGIGAAVITTAALLRAARPAGAELRPGEKDGVVYLHQFPRWAHGPNLSPFCLKLETALRLAKVEYEVVPGLSGAKATSKSPFLRVDGQEISDSGLCIRWLREARGVDLDKGLTREQHALGRALQRMLEEGTYFAVVHHRWIQNPGVLTKFFSKPAGMPDFAVPWVISFVRRLIRSSLYSQGIDRFDFAEVTRIFSADMEALDAHLAQRKGRFLFGDTMTSYDACIFAFTSSVLYAPFETFRKIAEALPDVVTYTTQCKEHVFPDWDDLCDKTQVR